MQNERIKCSQITKLKDRDGTANKKLPLFFNGAVDFFKELPKTDDIEGMRRVYEYINELNRLN